MLKNLRLTGGRDRAPEMDSGWVFLVVDIICARVCLGCGGSGWGGIGGCSENFLMYTVAVQS